MTLLQIVALTLIDWGEENVESVQGICWKRYFAVVDRPSNSYINKALKGKCACRNEWALEKGVC